MNEECETASSELCLPPTLPLTENLFFTEVHVNIRNQGWPTDGKDEARGQGPSVKYTIFNQRGVLHLAKKEFDGRFD